MWAASLWAVLPLSRRWREEKADHRAALAVEWSEVRDFNARRAVPAADLMRELRNTGASALVIAPSMLEDLLVQRRVHPVGASQGTRLHVEDPVLARQIWKQASWRSITGLQWNSVENASTLSRAEGFASLAEMDAGYDPLLVRHVRASGLTPILRVYDDPWLARGVFQTWLASQPSDFVSLGVLFSSEEFPGRAEGRLFWRSWLKRQGAVHVLPELNATLASRKIARAFPESTYRIHSIASNELKDFPPAKQMPRWRRALEERSCRLLLVRMAPNDSWESFLSQVAAVANLIERAHLQKSFPVPRAEDRLPSAARQALSPWMALAIVCLTPASGLSWAKQAFPRWRVVFLRILFVSLAGALVAAAVADNPYTRLAITPFRGVKAGFLVSWVLTLLVMYDWSELRGFLSRTLTRKDVLIGAVAAAALGYLLLRSGNASAGWKPPWEQAARDGLEALLVARPRLKEWAIGHPLLWAGCYLQALFLQRRSSRDGRLFICLGMIGPISMINTFCHLHSPLWVELLRSLNGLAIGVLGGFLLTGVLGRWLRRRDGMATPRSAV